MSRNSIKEDKMNIIDEPSMHHQKLRPNIPQHSNTAAMSGGGTGGPAAFSRNSSRGSRGHNESYGNAMIP